MHYSIEFLLDGFTHTVKVQSETTDIGMGLAKRIAKEAFDIIQKWPEEKRMDFYATFNNKEERLAEKCAVLATNIETSKNERSTAESVRHEVINQLMEKISTMETSFST